jgi:hypothetical protein
MPTEVPTQFCAGLRVDASPLGFSRFCCPRIGRGLSAKYPCHCPAYWPWPCPVRDHDRSLSVSTQQSRLSPQPTQPPRTPPAGSWIRPRPKSGPSSKALKHALKTLLRCPWPVVRDFAVHFRFHTFRFSITLTSVYLTISPAGLIPTCTTAPIPYNYPRDMPLIFTIIGSVSRLRCHDADSNRPRLTTKF